MRRSCIWGSFAAIAALLVTVATAQADIPLNGLLFNRLLETGTPQWPYTRFGSGSFGDGNLVLWDSDASPHGPPPAFPSVSINPISGGRTPLLNQQTRIWQLSVTRGELAFSDGNGIYAGAEGQPPILDALTTNGAVYTDGSLVIYGNDAHTAIYAKSMDDVSVRTVIDSSFTFFRTGDHPTFAEFSEIRNGNLLVFTGAPSFGGLTDEGIFRWNGSSLVPVVQIGDPAPGGATYRQLWLPVHFDGAGYSFTASLSDGRYVVIEHRSGSDVIALDLNHPINGSEEVMSGSPYAADGGYIAFSTRQLSLSTGVPVGLYTDLWGGLTRVLAYGQTLDGETVNAFSPFAIDTQTRTLVAEVGFTDGNYALYVTNLPEPTTSIVAIAALLCVRRRPRMRR